MQRFYDDDGFNFAVLIALGSTYRGLADVGEVLTTVEKVPNGDRDAFVREWSALADRLTEAADESERSGRAVSMRTALLRASGYYDLASSMAPGSSDPDRFDSLWERYRECWERSLPAWDVPVEKIAVPYEGTTLEGYWFGRTDRRDERRPTIILNNGSDGPVSAMWLQGGAAAVARMERDDLRRTRPGRGSAPPGRCGTSASSTGSRRPWRSDDSARTTTPSDGSTARASPSSLRPLARVVTTSFRCPLHGRIGAVG